MPRPASAAAAIAKSAPVFAALGDPTRLGIVLRLCDAGPTSIARLTDGADVTRQAISKHLRVLEDAGLVRATRSGRESVVELEQQRLADAQRCIELISKHWDDALGRLKLFVEE